MSELPLGASTWCFINLMPANVRDVLLGAAPSTPGEIEAARRFFAELAELIPASDIKALELWHSSLLWDEDVRPHLRRLSDTGLIFSGHAPFRPDIDVASLNELIRRRGISACCEFAKLLAGLGGKKLVMHGGWAVDVPSQARERAERSAASIAEIADYCGKLGLDVAVELLPMPAIWTTADELHDMLRLVDRPNVGVCLDVNHVLPVDALIPTVHSLGPHILTLHVSDSDEAGERHWRPTAGMIDWPALIRALREINYAGSFMYEVYLQSMSIRHAVSTIEENYRSLMEMPE